MSANNIQRTRVYFQSSNSTSNIPINKTRYRVIIVISSMYELRAHTLNTRVFNSSRHYLRFSSPTRLNLSTFLYQPLSPSPHLALPNLPFLQSSRALVVGTTQRLSPEMNFDLPNVHPRRKHSRDRLCSHAAASIYGAGANLRSL